MDFEKVTGIVRVTFAVNVLLRIY